MSAAAALQAALVIEHQVVYGYGVVGAHLVGGPRRTAGSRLVAHQELRDRLATILRAAGATPAAARPAYALPFPVDSADAAVRLATLLEEATAGAAWDLVAATGPSSGPRRLGVSTLADAAAAAAGWRLVVGDSSDPALPGQPGERAAVSQPSTTPTSSSSPSTTASGSTS